MFRQLATAKAEASSPGNVDESAMIAGANWVLTEHRPSQLAEFLERFWESGYFAWGDHVLSNFGGFARRKEHADDSCPAMPPPDTGLAHVPSTRLTWQHLVYAYMLENTRVVEIMRRVVREYAHGEKLPTPDQQVLSWARATEELFYTSPRPNDIVSLTSDIRSDAGAIRRNAYYRLLGMDLNHGAEGETPYPYVKADAANRGFAELFEQLLGEVWKGYSNRNNLMGENRTDDQAIQEFLRRLKEMLTARKMNGALLREEFSAVAMLSWFHLTLEYDTAVVKALNAESTSFAERLRKVGGLVGISAHARSDAYEQMAVPMSVVLTAIEGGASNPGDFYLDGGLFTSYMREIMTHWPIATGRALKQGPAVLAPVVTEAPAGNGNGRFTVGAGVTVS